MKTRLVNTITLAIGLSPVIDAGITNLPSGNFNAFKGQLVYEYSAGLSGGSFDAAAAGRAYGPLLAAIIFKKVMSKLKVGKLII